MSEVRGCQIPEGLYYWIEKHVWVRDEGDDVVTIGITDPAQHLAARVVAVTTKKVGKFLERGQSVATVESGKWVGPVPTPATGEVVETNEATFAADVLIANRDPYGAGWISRLQPDAWPAPDAGLVNSDPYGAGWVVRLKATLWTVQRAELHTGPHAVDEYRAFLEREGISCG
jgi:glycine cleavage system H protein